MNKDDKTIVAVAVIFIIGVVIGFFAGADKPAEIVEKTQIILQKCEPTSLEYAAYRLEKKKYFDERCPNGWQERAGSTLSLDVRCYD